MSQAVWRNPFLCQRSLFGAGSSNVFLQNVFESRPGHDIAASVQEERSSLGRAAHLKPITKSGRGLFPQRKHPLATALAHHVNGGPRVEGEISQAQPDQLRSEEHTSEL